MTQNSRGIMRYGYPCTLQSCS